MDFPTDNTRVTLDGETSFPAHDTGHRWNGFVCPTFTRETAQAIVAWNEATLTGEDDERLSWDGDVVVITSPVYVAEQEDYTPERVAPDAHGRYPIGAHGWTWQTAEDEDTVSAVVTRIRSEVLPVWGMEAFRGDPGGLLAYHGFRESHAVCAAAIARVLTTA